MRLYAWSEYTERVNLVKSNIAFGKLGSLARALHVSSLLNIFILLFWVANKQATQDSHDVGEKEKEVEIVIISSLHP